MRHFAEDAKPVEQILVDRRGIMAEQQAGHMRHDAALFEPSEQRGLRFNAVEALVILQKEHVLSAFGGGDLPRGRQKDKVAQIAARQHALRRSGGQRAPVGIRNVLPGEAEQAAFKLRQIVARDVRKYAGHLAVIGDDAGLRPERIENAGAVAVAEIQLGIGPGGVIVQQGEQVVRSFSAAKEYQPDGGIGDQRIEVRRALPGWRRASQPRA